MRRAALDRRHGAAVVLREALDGLHQMLRGRGAVPPEEWSRRWLEGLERLRREQWAMGALQNLAQELIASTGSLGGARRLARVVRRWSRRVEEESRGIRRRWASRLPSRAHLLTFSWSSAVESLLTPPRVRPRIEEIGVSVSDPGGEGRGLYRRLRSAGLPVRLLPDRKAREAVQAGTLVLLGADTLYADGTLLHKVGTRALATAAKRAGARVISVSGTSKRVAAPAPRFRRRGLFETTPPSLVDEYWTERGAWRPAARASRKV